VWSVATVLSGGISGVEPLGWLKYRSQWRRLLNPGRVAWTTKPLPPMRIDDTGTATNDR